MEDIPYSTTFQVMAPLLVASPTKMNVLYRGVDNPLEFSVPGVPADHVRPVIDNGSIISAGNGWIVKDLRVGKAHLTAQATMPDGSMRSIGPVEFRVKDLPAPMAYVNGKGARESHIRKSELTAAEGIVARLENSDFNEPFIVTGCTILIMHGGLLVPYKLVGNRFDPQMHPEVKKMFAALHDGEHIYFEDIKARLANGQGDEYTLTPITWRVVR